MRITVSFALLLVLSNFKTSFQMAVVKGLGSQPETTEDCSGGETTQVPEAANVRTKNPETDLLNDVDLTQHPTTEPGKSLLITTTKEKRCARRETISVDDRVGATLSLTRRDVSVEKLKQKCESCRNTNLCKKMKLCTLCKGPCEKAEAAEAVTNANMLQVAPETSTLIPQTETAQPTNTVTDDTIVGSRFGESEDAQKPRYYSLGLIEPGPLMHLFAKAFNIPSEDNFEKLIILGKLRGEEVEENLNNLLIIDMAQVFGKNKQTFATVHQPTNIDPAKIAELDRRLDEGFARKKQELNIDRLNNDQIYEVIEQVLAEMTQNNTPVDNKENVLEDQRVELPETQTKCSVDEAVNDLLDVMPMSAPERSKEEKPPQQHEDKGQITNPPVIQDGLNIVGKNVDDGWIDDNGEAEPGTLNPEIAPRPAVLENSDSVTPNQNNVEDNMIGEVLSISGDTKPSPESDNQINEPHKNVEARINTENINANTITGPNSSENFVGETVPKEESLPENSLTQNVYKTVEDSLKMASDIVNDDRNLIGESASESSQNSALAQDVLQTVNDGLKIVPSNLPQQQETGENVIGESAPTDNTLPGQDLEKNIIKTVQDALKISSDALSNNQQAQSNMIGEPVLEHGTSQSDDLRKSILQTVEDSLKTPSDSDLLNNLPNNNIVEQNEPVFLENQDNTAKFPSVPTNNPAETGNVEVSNNDDFGGPETVPNKNEMDNVVIPQKDNLIEIEDESSESEESVENIVQPQNAELPPSIDDPKVAESLQEVDNRGQFSDESDSSEKLSNFGSLVPLKKLSLEGDNEQMQRLYFLGKDIKLPLQMYQDKNGVMQLRVDVDKLCHCKNKNCTRKHPHKHEIEITEKNFLINEDKEIKVEDTEKRRHEDLMNSFVDHPHENSEIFKRSPKIESKFEHDQRNNIEVDDDKLKIEGIYKFEKQEEEKFEEELKRINENLKDYFNKENSVPLNKGNVALYKDVEKTKDVGRLITLANNLLVWMKDLAVNNLSS